MKALLMKKAGTKWKTITVSDKPEPGALGRVLAESYSSEDKVDELFSAGSVERVRPEPRSEGHAAVMETKTNINKKVKDGSYRFFYRFDGGKWEVLRTGTKDDWVELRGR